MPFDVTTFTEDTGLERLALSLLGTGRLHLERGAAIYHLENNPGGGGSIQRRHFGTPSRPKRERNFVGRCNRLVSVLDPAAEFSSWTPQRCRTGSKRRATLLTFHAMVSTSDARGNSVAGSVVAQRPSDFQRARLAASTDAGRLGATCPIDSCRRGPGRDRSTASR